MAAATTSTAPTNVELLNLAGKILATPAQSNPHVLLELLQSLWHQCWSKSRFAFDLFHRSAQDNNNNNNNKSFQLILHLLRPRALDYLKEYPDSDDLRCGIWTWASCLLGKITELWPSRYIPLLISDGTWLPALLIKTIGGSDKDCKRQQMMEYTRGALVALNALSISGRFRDIWIDWAQLRPALHKCFIDSTAAADAKTIPLCLRLAVWREAIELCNRMLAEPGIDMFDDGDFTMTCSSSPLTFLGQNRLPIRQDLWHCLFGDELGCSSQLVSGLLAVLYFIHSQAPRSANTGQLKPISAGGSKPPSSDYRQPITLSGPGLVFRDSAMNFADLTMPLCSLLHTIQRLVLISSSIQRCLSNDYRFYRCLSDLLIVYQNFDCAKEDLSQLLMSIGVGKPMNQTVSELARCLFSEKPIDVWYALKALGHRPPLISVDGMHELMSQGGARFLMEFLERHPIQQASAEFRDCKLGRDFLLQRSIDREAVLLCESHSWFTLFRGYAAHIFGEFVASGEMNLIAEFHQRPQEYCDVLLAMLKNGTDIEQWGAADAIATLLQTNTIEDSEISERLVRRASFIAIKLLSIRSNHHVGFLAKQQLFTQPQDNQWKFELWNSALVILYRSAVLIRDIWSGLNQAGIMPTIFTILKHICVMHGIQIVSVCGKATNNHFARPNREPPTKDLCFTYDGDQTLPQLLYSALKILQLLCNQDSFCREVALWDDHLALLAAISDFCDADVRKAVRQLVEDLISHNNQEIRKIQSQRESRESQVLEKAMLSARHLQSLEDVCVQSEQSELFWPAHLVRPPVFCLVTGLIPEDIVSPAVGQLLRCPSTHYKTHQLVNDEAFISQWQIGRQMESYLLLKICSRCNTIETRSGQFIQRFDSGLQRNQLFCSKHCWEQLKRARMMAERQKTTHLQPIKKHSGGLKGKLMAIFS